MKIITSLISGLMALALITSAYAGTDSKEMAAISPPPEKPSNWYIGVFGGADFDQDYSGKNSSFAGSDFNSSIGTTVGGVGGLKVGYKFASYDLGGGFAIEPAVEFEAAYIDPQVTTQVGSITSTEFIGEPLLATAHPLEQGDATLTTVQNVSMTAQMSAVTFGVNGLARFKTGTLFTPYVGAGIGGEWIDMSQVNFTTTTTTTLNGIDPTTTTSSPGNSADDVVFTFKGIVGFDFEIAKNWDLFTEYNYLVAVSPSFTFYNAGGTGANYTFKNDLLGQNLITTGIKYSF